MKEFNKILQAQFAIMCATGKLFKSSIPGIKVWETYLNEFKEGDDPQFRDPESSVHNCNHCNNFIRRYGNIVAIDKDFNIITIFDVKVDKEYQASVDAMGKLLRKAPVDNIFLETVSMLDKLPYETVKLNQDVYRLGTDKNHKRYTKAEADMYGVVKANEVRTFNHMHLDLPKKFVDSTGKSIESIQAEYRSAKDVFMRAMVEIPLETLDLVIDLINQGSLLDGATHLSKVILMKNFKESFIKVPASKRHNWCWLVSHKLGIAKFKNELIGVLCSELAEGEEINKACQSWNKRVDPANYMKAVAPITEAQKKNAQAFVEENGYTESFDRRIAVIDDIKVNEILHSNIGEGKIKTVSMFDDVQTSSSRHKRNEFKGVEEVSIEKFMKDILPGCTGVEAYLENRLKGNLVAMTTAKDKECKSMFKWDNPFSWTYEGNLAGKSMIEEAIIKRGGKTDGVFNVRLHFPESTTDYDVRIKEPNGNSINYNNVRRTHHSSGRLDLDAQGVDGNFSADKRVENINYTSMASMPKGKYIISVKDFGGGSNKGFLMEVKTPEGLTRYKCDAAVIGEKNFIEVNFDGNSFTSVVVNNTLKIVDSEVKPTEMYGLESQQFHKVNLMCLSPNHWGENKTGNKHYFFMLEGCKSNTPVRGFHNENLDPELAKHRKVLEVLGAVNMIEPTDKQLAGLGFNATIKDEVILRLKGNFKRVIKVKF